MLSLKNKDPRNQESKILGEGKTKKRMMRKEVERRSMKLLKTISSTYEFNGGGRGAGIQ